MDKLLELGRLPFIKKLIDSGFRSVLKSTIPPVSGPAWLSFATGMNPGKVGVFDFFNRRRDRTSLSPVNSQDYEGKALWDLVSDLGLKVGIFNYPMLYPPYAINGMMVSGVGCPDHSKLTYPSSLKLELDQVAGGYKVELDYQHKRYEDCDLFLKDLDRLVEKQEKAVYYVLKKEEWDLFIAVFSFTDWAQHLMWRHLEKQHPLYDKTVSLKYQAAFASLWKKVDSIIQNIVQISGNETNIFLLSDHGFGPQKGCFNLVSWMNDKGYLIRQKRPIKYSMLELVKPFLEALSRLHVTCAFPIRFRQKVADKTEIDLLDQIDLTRSSAYTLEHSIPFGAIYLNEAKETFTSKREQLKRRIIDELETFCAQAGVKLQVFEPSEIYQGDKVDLAPDIIFTINNWECVIVKSFDAPLFTENSYSTRHTGSHRMEGILISHGPDINEGISQEPIEIYDVAPTILHLLGVPISPDMDGSVRYSIFKRDSEPYRREVRCIQKKEKDRVKAKIKDLKRHHV